DRLPLGASSAPLRATACVLHLVAHKVLEGSHSISIDLSRFRSRLQSYSSRLQCERLTAHPSRHKTFSILYGHACYNRTRNSRATSCECAPEPPTDYRASDQRPFVLSRSGDREMKRRDG